VYKPGRYDHVGNSHAFLKYFMECNHSKMEGTKTHQTYVWSSREKTPSGSALLDVVTQGLERPKFAADCLNVLLKELRANSSEGACKVSVVVDGINVLFEETSMVCKDWPSWRPGIYSRKVKERLCAVEELSVMRQLRKMFGNDYNNALVVCSVDKTHSIRLSKRVRAARFWDEDEVELLPDTRPDFPFALLGEGGRSALSFA
jgi:hypothetical protein